MSAKTLALVFGIIFVIVGLLGFVPNPLVGANGLFLTNVVHDLVHLIIGLILLAVALWAPAQSGMWLKIMGAVYLVIFLLGLVMGSPMLGLVAFNGADNWLHLLLGIVLLAAGFWASDAPVMPSMPAAM